MRVPLAPEGWRVDPCGGDIAFMAPTPADVLRDALEAWNRQDFEAMLSVFDERAYLDVS